MTTIQKALDEYASKASHIKLPDLDMAMHPEQVYFAEDVSDSAFFNERFIESRAQEHSSSFALLLMMMGHNLLLILLVLAFTYETVNLTLIILSLFLYLIIAAPLYFANKFFHPMPIRFNRQAQCIHMLWNKETAITFPWKTATAFSKMGVSSSGTHGFLFLCPTPDDADLGGTEDLAMVEVPGAFSDVDHLSIRTNLKRLEFIRCYMEKGLGAIQPDSEAVKNGLSQFTEKDDKLTVKRHGLMALTGNFIQSFFYILATGWLVDKWVAKRAKNCVWPDEVERLCAEGADVSAYDTTVITPRSDLFFGQIKGQFTYFDRYGNEVT